MSNCCILWCGKYNQSTENQLHSHNYFQMIGILNGTGTVYIDEQPYEIQKNQIFLFLPQKLHSIHCGKKNTSIKILDIKFTISDPVLAEDLLKLGNMFYLHDFNHFLHFFDKIIDESTQQNFYYHSLICNYLHELLIHIIRERLTTSSPIYTVETPTDLIKKNVDITSLIQYININYPKNITLEDLSTLADINKTTLISIFKQLYGTTPINYVNKVRLSKAKELLVNTDMNVSEIADLVGFQSIYYFSRYFKAKENCTPIEYRTQNQQSRYFTFENEKTELLQLQ